MQRVDEIGAARVRKKAGGEQEGGQLSRASLVT
jgi:hypothetical protein